MDIMAEHLELWWEVRMVLGFKYVLGFKNVLYSYFQKYVQYVLLILDLEVAGPPDWNWRIWTMLHSCTW